MSWVIDTSVAVKWVFPEQGSEAALLLIGQHLIAPDLMRAELAHALYKKVKAGQATPLQALMAQAQVESMLDFVPSIALSRRTLELSLELDHAAGDCLFLAVAELADTPMITAAAKFVTSCGGTSYARLVSLLG